MPPPALPTETRAWASPRPMPATGARISSSPTPTVSCTASSGATGRTPMRTLGRTLLRRSTRRLPAGARFWPTSISTAAWTPPSRMGPSRLPTWLWTRSRSRCSAASRARRTSAPASGSVTPARQRPRPGGGRLRQRRRPRSGRRLDRRPAGPSPNSGAEGHWLQVRLPSFSPGASVAVLPRQTREVQAGASYLSSGDRVHFGLGAATNVRALVVRYPDGGVDRLPNVAVDRLVLRSRTNVTFRWTWKRTAPSSTTTS